MTTKIRKWGNSYAVRVPKALAHKLGVRDGSAINFKIEPVHRKPTLNELLDQIRPENIHPLIDWGPDVGHQIRTIDWQARSVKYIGDAAHNTVQDVCYELELLIKGE